MSRPRSPPPPYEDSLSFTSSATPPSRPTGPLSHDPAPPPGFYVQTGAHPLLSSGENAPPPQGSRNPATHQTPDVIGGYQHDGSYWRPTPPLQGQVPGPYAPPPPPFQLPPSKNREYPPYPPASTGPPFSPLPPPPPPPPPLPPPPSSSPHPPVGQTTYQATFHEEHKPSMQRFVIEERRRRVNHILHCCISIFFFPWIIVWIVLCIQASA
ncbi:extensin [Aplysia californica]|uniref:Extensin n=1 Tax=Aplysia californica TaxID=6500 RepID=A0ABM0JKW1_APLCA|nr:extensin [Aplysia californica]